MENCSMFDGQTKVEFILQFRSIPYSIDLLFESVPIELKALFEENEKLQEGKVPNYYKLRSVLFKLSRAFAN
jgi:hypothetical protein